MSRRFRAEQTRSLYSKLPKDSSVARLVTILPAGPREFTSDDAISSNPGHPNWPRQMVCEIDEFDVKDDSIQYKALSYSWKDADPRENVNILAYGKLALDIPAFRNLDEAGPIMRGFQAIAERSWWERVWVVQEVVVANKVTVFYGTIAVPWNLFCNAAEQLHRSQQNCHLDSMYPYLTEGQPLSDFARLVSDIESTRMVWRSRTPLVALQLLRKFRSRKASDPKDKVFALLGLVQYWGRSQPLAADYSHSIESTFLGTMMMLISSTESLSVIAGSTGRACLEASKVPSWVIDWSSYEEENEYRRLRSLLLYSAGAGIQGSVRLHGGGLLESPAYWIGKVELLGAEFSVQASTKDRRAVVSSWGTLMVHAEDPYPTGESLKEVFWRTICGNIEHFLDQGVPRDDDDDNVLGNFKRASFNAESGWNQWRSADKKHNRKTSRIGSHWLEVPGLTNNEKKRNAFNYALSCASGGRRLFVTDQGRVGIGPKNMEIGDDVFALCGSQVPFVLRQSKRSPRACQGAIPETLFRKSQQRQYIAAGKDASEELLQTLKGEARICNQAHWLCYAVIGDAYVHGVMHEDQNIGRTQTTVFLA
ncbi:hypothetical protein PG991_001565 [Apiospora marii]|uniref:Heterokaryon incompatibility domain-containing protein n=1 Tax=Apiospora marii TaxID=335849 RepID=A0ABR1SQ26_9PEZI